MARGGVEPSMPTRGPTRAAELNAELRVFGGVTLVNGDQCAIARPSHRRLLALLLLEAEHLVPVGRLVDRFWRGQPPKTAKGALHTHVSALRKRLPSSLIETDRNGYRIVLTNARLDCVDFVAAALRVQALARVGRWHEVLAEAAVALSIWDEPYVELADDDFAQPEIARIRELHLSIVEAQAEALIRLDRANEAVADLEWAARSFPLREGVVSLLARARERTGCHADALRSLRDTERALAELGLEPSPALRALEAQILAHRIEGGSVGYTGPERRRTA